MDKLKEYLTLVMDKFTDNKKLIIICLVLVGIIIFAGSIQAGGRYEPKGDSHDQNTNNTNINANHSSSKASAGASSNSGARSNSGGNLIHASGGRSGSSSSATGGDSTATGGVGVGIGGKVGNTTSSSGGNAQDISIDGDTDNSMITYEGNEHTASSSASVYAGYCQTGGSGQTESGGFAIISSDQFCDHIRAAEEMLKAYKEAVSHCICESVCTTEVASVEMVCEGDNKEQAAFYLEAYHENMRDAHSLVQTTQTTGLIGRIAAQLGIPIALVAAVAIAL